MPQRARSTFQAQVFSCWNWKCALLSAAARSSVYLAALRRSGSHGRLSIVLVEMGYVALTAGVYAALQQRALGLRSRVLGNVLVAAGVPALAQTLDWLAHRAVGAAVPSRATIAVSVFTGVSALFHQFVMRRGVFLTGRGCSLWDDFRLIPKLIAAFVAAPVLLLVSGVVGTERAAEPEGIL